MLFRSNIVAKSLLVTSANTTAFEGRMPSLITFCDDIEFLRGHMILASRLFFCSENMLPRACVRGFRNCSLFLLILFHHQFDSLLTAILIVIFLKEIASSAYVVCVIYVWSNLRMASHVKFFRSACNHIFHSNCWLKKKLTCPICCV